MSFLTLWEMKEYAERRFSSNKTNIQLMLDVLCLQLFLFYSQSSFKTDSNLDNQKKLFFGGFLLRDSMKSRTLKLLVCCCF